MAAGDITYSNAGGESGHKPFASGIVLADASAAINVLCGFQPSRITIHYKDTGATTQDKKIEWFKGMTAANYWNTAASGALTLVTSGGPVVYADTDGEGFTIPAGLQDADSDTMYWTAWR